MELWLEPWAILAFFVLLFACVFMLVKFYVCDNENCKAFTDAEEEAQPGTKEYTLALLNNLYSDGIWALPYIGAAIIAPLSLWIIGIPITVRNFAVVFLISFFVTYFLFAFLGHHYVKFITSYVANYIEDNCPATSANNTNNTNNTNDANNNSPVTDDINNTEEISVTFTSPVNSS